jgi:putative PIN family toxin of toxin-antitoxin system
MTRVVLDTNILVSAGISAGGDCDRIVRAVLRKDLQALVSPGILGEYLEILNRSTFTKYGFPPVWVQRFIEVAEHLAADPSSLPSSPDPDDRLFLGVAQYAGVLVTGNLKHFPEEHWGKARVLSPGAFLRWVGTDDARPLEG